MLGVPGEQPLTLGVTELSPSEAQQLLRQMAQPLQLPEAHAQVIELQCPCKSFWVRFWKS